MRPWSIAIAVFAGILIVLVIAGGRDDRTFAGRENAGVGNRPGQQLLAAAVVLGPQQTINLVLTSALLSTETAQLLSDARDLVQEAATQPPDQAKRTLDQAAEKLDDAMKQLQKAADDTDNLAVRVRLQQLRAALAVVKKQVEFVQERLVAFGPASMLVADGRG